MGPKKKFDFVSNLKEQVLMQLNKLKPGKNATAAQAVQCLVKQAQFYTNFLLSKHHEQVQTGKKKRGRKRKSCQIEEDNQEINEEKIFTRLQKQPSLLKGGQLKNYQLVGLNWMVSLYESGINGILADDMGLGKTIQTISMLAFVQEYKNISRPFLIIGPKVTLGNWTNELKKWLPKKRVVKLLATKEQRQQLLQDYIKSGDFDVVVTSFEGVRLCLNYLKKIHWHYVIIDEAHKLKNEDSQISKVLRQLWAQHKLLLTGTPLQNNLKQLWSLLNFLLPQLFDSSDLFENWFDNYEAEGGKQLSQQEIEKKNAHLILQLHKILRPFMLRRTKLEVERSLPSKKEVHIYVGLTDMQLKVYKSLLQSRNVLEGQKRTYLNLLMQLRKVCNHPYLFPDMQDTSLALIGEHLVFNSGKMLVLDRLLRKLYAQKNHKVLIFSQMTMLLDILEDYCKLRQYEYCRIDGSTEMISRQEQIEDFMKQDSQKFVFLLSTRAGGLGINLTAADTVIIYDSDWNPQMDLQAMDRAHRIGQKNKVNVYRLITENTVEQKIIQRQTVKLKWDSLVIQQSKTASQQKTSKNLSKDQMKNMLQFGASTIIKASKGTISDEQIDELLKRGESKTLELNKEVEEKLKKQQQNLIDFNMNSINIFDFMQKEQDEKKRKEDSQALAALLPQRETLSDMRSRREKNKLNYFENLHNDYDSSIDDESFKLEKEVNLPDHHFYEQKQLLKALLQRELNSKGGLGLTEDEQQLKNSLLESGFRNWNKADFMKFISGCEKYGRNDHVKIAKKVGKPVKDIQKYGKVFWDRLDELPEKEKILKGIQLGEQKLKSMKEQEKLLEWKSQHCSQVYLDPTFYKKCKSKYFTYYNDCYLANQLVRFGLNDMGSVREQIKQEPLFMFDYYFKTRSQGQLNKRLPSIFKVLQKEKQQLVGFEDKQKLSKKQTKLKKIAQKNELSEGTQV